VRALLQHGANVNAAENEGDTALAYATQNGHGAVANLLMQHAAQVLHVSSLETNTLDNKHEGGCCVCQCEWEIGDKVRVLPCGHRFHIHCIDRWLIMNQPTCPLCKKDIRGEVCEELEESEELEDFEAAEAWTRELEAFEAWHRESVRELAAAQAEGAEVMAAALAEVAEVMLAPR